MGNANAIVEMLRDENENLKKGLKTLKKLQDMLSTQMIKDLNGCNYQQPTLRCWKQCGESIKEAQEAKEGYEELRKELLLVHELKQVGKE